MSTKPTTVQEYLINNLIDMRESLDVKGVTAEREIPVVIATKEVKNKEGKRTISLFKMLQMLSPVCNIRVDVRKMSTDVDGPEAMNAIKASLFVSNTTLLPELIASIQVSDEWLTTRDTVKYTNL